MSSLESLLESLLLVEDSLPGELKLELELEVEDAVVTMEHNPHQCRAMVARMLHPVGNQDRTKGHQELCAKGAGSTIDGIHVA